MKRLFLPILAAILAACTSQSKPQPMPQAKPFPRNTEVNAVVDVEYLEKNLLQGKDEVVKSQHESLVTLKDDEILECVPGPVDPRLDRVCFHYFVQQKDGDRLLTKRPDAMSFWFVCETTDVIECFEVPEDASSEAIAKPQDFYPGETRGKMVIKVKDAG